MKARRERQTRRNITASQNAVKKNPNLKTQQ